MLCIAAGAVAIAIPAVMLWSAIQQEQQLTRTWQQVPRPGAHPGNAGAQSGAGAGHGSSSGSSGGTAASAAQVAFAVRVPKLGYYAAVREGVSDSVLFAGPGHYPTTAAPGRQGNVGVAAHNTYWLQFGRLSRGDTVVLEARDGSYSYRVIETKVVKPGDRTVLASTPDHRLTLTTCWPLWAGALAPDRLAIVAEEVGPASS